MSLGTFQETPGRPCYKMSAHCCELFASTHFCLLKGGNVIAIALRTNLMTRFLASNVLSVCGKCWERKNMRMAFNYNLADIVIHLVVPHSFKMLNPIHIRHHLSSACPECQTFQPISWLTISSVANPSLEILYNLIVYIFVILCIVPCLQLARVAEKLEFADLRGCDSDDNQL